VKLTARGSLSKIPVHRDFAHNVGVENGASAATRQEIFGAVDPLMEANAAKAATKAGAASRCVLP
jgi:hypothetical protein